MNVSTETPNLQELLGNSTWAYPGHHQNYTLSPPLVPGKIKPAACEQLHIAVEVRQRAALTQADQPSPARQGVSQTHNHWSCWVTTRTPLWCEDIDITIQTVCYL